MLIVAVGLLASGEIRTRRPLARSYSVIPSTVAPSVTPCGSCAASGAVAKASIAASRRPLRAMALQVMNPRDGRDIVRRSKLGFGRVVLKAGRCDGVTCLPRNNAEMEPPFSRIRQILGGTATKRM